MRWDRFFEDLEDQLDSEWEAERAALDTEAERLRLSRVALRERLVALSRQRRDVVVHLVDGSTLTAQVARVGADWFAIVSAPAAGALISQPVIVPVSALTGIGAPMDAVLASVRDADAGPPLGQRMGLGFVLRDLVRRRVAVTVQLVGGRELPGTIDRAGADHLDLAVHDRGTPRRAENVTGYRVVPFTAIVLVRLAEASDLD